ncbi:NADH dehydrogenase [ubiquinone] 1 alpha subcomplex subunit 4-like 2 [Cynoglossus semilaevis]|uniref:NDUFA4 mitochondrial complex associated like 2a n=1 Tax=Cynoglossus semilaevis TaxID=244447 RepID=A0A3P8WW06_CYNSE|nr:NADH dehydrogenase [ubiquinone] 1 alpha subcomplex subunit 4-like 2 [Cynoglossus semilaevis]
MIFRATVRHAKNNPALIPQFLFIGVGLGGAALYLLRLATGPYVVWNRAKDPEPWTKLPPTYQYKFAAVSTDYQSLKKEGPDY